MIGYQRERTRFGLNTRRQQVYKSRPLHLIYIRINMAIQSLLLTSFGPQMEIIELGIFLSYSCDSSTIFWNHTHHFLTLKTDSTKDEIYFSQFKLCILYRKVYISLKNNSSYCAAPMMRRKKSRYLSTGAGEKSALLLFHFALKQKSNFLLSAFVALNDCCR